MRIVMMGTGGFAQPTFQALLDSSHEVIGLITQPDRPTGHERGSSRQVGRSMKDVALEHTLPVLQPESINTPEGIHALQALQPELLVVAAYGQILSREVLAVPSQGGINVHASLLPRYRGAAPIAWAIYHGEMRTGVTIIRMSVQLDAGDMLAQQAIDIGPHETAGELEARLAPLGARLALDVIDQLLRGSVHGIKQDRSLATRAPKLKKEDGLIDWTRHARDVCNQVRAMQPWPTAYTYWHRHEREPLRLLLTRTAWHEAAPGGPHAPGDVCAAPEPATHLWIAAGSGSAVEVLELQPAGKRRMSIAEFLRGHRPQPGERLGPPPS